VLGVVLSARKDWIAVDALRQALGWIEIIAPPNLFQFQSQLAAIALYCGVVLCPSAWRPLEGRACRVLGRLSFSIYLLHFPILFTLACLLFTVLQPALPPAASVAVMFVAFIGLTLLAALLFERWIDRPAIAVSRLIGAPRLRHA
jgi:peptidoglycan/LPS O-acetylase OafA/YrhL